MTFKGLGVRLSALLCVVLMPLMVLAQDIPSETGSKLAPLVRNALDAAIPSSSVYGDLVWRNRNPKKNISKSEFVVEIMPNVRLELEKSAKAKLAPVSQLSAQLDKIAPLLVDAVSASLLIAELQGRLSAEEISAADWSEASKTWLSTDAFLQRIGNVLDEQPSQIHDPRIQEQFALFRAILIPLSSSIAIDMKNKNLKSLQISVPKLGEALSRLHIVASLQVYALYGDFDEVTKWANRMGITEQPSVGPLATLRQFITMPSNCAQRSDK